MRRGLTMVETLVSLGILSALLSVVATWTRVATRTGADAARDARWTLAAEAVMDLIQIDLKSGDAEPGRDNRVEVDDGALRIRTRSTAPGDVRGSTVHSYSLRSGTLRRGIQTGDPVQERPLVDEISAWTCAIEEERRLLSVVITARAGTIVRRTFSVP